MTDSTNARTIPPLSRRANAILWSIQGLLALLFLFAGGTKLALPIAELTKQSTLPGGLLRFIGAAEVAGALGLILPGLLGIRRELTALAAAGLVLIMIGATIITAASGAIASAVFPLVVGLLAAVIAFRRRAVSDPRLLRTPAGGDHAVAT